MLSTGGGFSTRALYTDDEEKIFTAQRPVILNGIDEVATNGDLLDRAIVIYLPRIPESQRVTEAQLQREFAEALPRILGAAVDVVALGLRSLPGVTCPRLPRMADFAQWGCAVAPGLGWSAEALLSTYGANRDTTSEQALEASLVAQVLVDIMEKERILWEGTAAELMELLNAKATEPTKKQRAWPKNPRALGHQLRRLAPNLRIAGVEVEFLPRKGRKRLIRIEHAAEVASFASPLSPESLAPEWETVEQ